MSTDNMPIDKATAAKIATLARIRLDDAQTESFAGELSGILNWVEMLGEVDTENVTPLANVNAMKLKRRADEVTDGQCQDKVLANAPESTEGFFVVPKVVE